MDHAKALRHQDESRYSLFPPLFLCVLASWRAPLLSVDHAKPLRRQDESRYSLFPPLFLCVLAPWRDPPIYVVMRGFSRDNEFSHENYSVWPLAWAGVPFLSGALRGCSELYSRQSHQFGTAGSASCLCAGSLARNWSRPHSHLSNSRPQGIIGGPQRTMASGTGSHGRGDKWRVECDYGAD